MVYGTLITPSIYGNSGRIVEDREAWHAAVHGVTKSWTWLSDWTRAIYGNWDNGKNPVWDCSIRPWQPSHRADNQYNSTHVSTSVWGRREGSRIQFFFIYGPPINSRPSQRTGFPSGSGGKDPLAKVGDAEMQVKSLGQEDPLEKKMTTRSSILAWRIPWTEKPGGLWSK